MKKTQIDWNAFFQSKHDLLVSSGKAKQCVLDKFERDLQEHKAQHHKWHNHKEEAEHARLINGLNNFLEQHRKMAIKE